MKKIILVLLFLLVHCTFVIDNCKSQVWTSLGSGLNWDCKSVCTYNNELVACGWFTIAGGFPANYIAKWNGMNWSPLGSGVSNGAFALTIFNNELIAGGSFVTAKWNGTSWSTLGSGAPSGVSALFTYNNELYAGGQLNFQGSNCIAKYNGTSWLPLGIGVNGGSPFTIIRAITTYKNEIIVGGYFTLAGGVNAINVAKWNGTSWSALGNGIAGDAVYSLVVYNNELIAGGEFGNLKKWNDTTWLSFSNGVNSGSVYGLHVYNNELYVGGTFQNAGGLANTKHIAKWNGTSWSSLGLGMTPPVSGNSVQKVTDYNNDIVVCGIFSSAGGITAMYVAKWGRGHSISGTVRYSDNNQPVTSGKVKAFKFDRNTWNVIYLDSANIQSDGTYTLTNVPQDTIDIGVFPNSTPPNDWVITYYPSTIYWENATLLYPTGNLTNINIGAIRMTATTNSNSVNGKVMRLNDNPVANLKDAVLYAKSGNTFVRCAVSDANGVYHLQSLPIGNLKILATRLGFCRDSISVNVTSTSNIDSINFYLHYIFTGIKQINSTIPSEYKLYQNYPNPFNPKTIIRFQIKDSRFVTLKVFDILGKEVAVLVNAKLQPGEYETQFPNNSITNNQLPSGIYFYKLIAGDFIETKRMVLIK